MKKVVVAVFAHPDDEAFGPAGTLAKFSKTHNVYILCATGGEAGKNSLSQTEKKLSDIRKKELHASAKIIGVKKVFFLGFEDGTLSNNLYHKLASKIEEKLKELKPGTVITFEPHGISGHIDHITVSFVTTFVVNRLKTVKNLYYYCILENERRREPGEYFIYFPDGYKRSEIDWENDISEVWEIKKHAMRAHKSQKHDADVILKVLEKLPKREHFLKFKPSA
jgi:LmbE family N-acetylglucosaminyl deacetylase